MNKYVKNFLLRGLLFSGFGPIIAGIVYMAIENSSYNFSLSGKEVFIAIVSTYLLAFIQAGASVFNQIEAWGIGKSLLCHLSTIYFAYVACYLVNSWIPFEPIVLLIFTAIFVAVYFVIWLSVFISHKAICKKMNKQLK